MDVNSTDFDIESGIKVFDRKQELRSHKGYWGECNINRVS